ncbi:hypothetical protein [Oceanivirga salmonicida]|uniref:hypothetical protein n=1 Tax=Oceanivirga salmonicida TaxID=1769291 RepID=UPI00082B0F5B|nr:hypothetical protein [Oceanivirga salmonicida]
MDINKFKNILSKFNSEEIEKILFSLIQSNVNIENLFLEIMKEKDDNILIIETQIFNNWNKALPAMSNSNLYYRHHIKEFYNAIAHLDEIENILNEYKEKISFETRKKLINMILEILTKCNFKDHFFPEKLYDIVIKLPINKEENINIANYLVKNNIFLINAILIYKKVNENDKFLKLAKENLDNTEIVLALVDYYEKNNMPELALKTAIKSLDEVNFYKSSIYEYVFNYYINRNMDKAIDDFFIQVYKNYHDFSITKLIYKYYSKRKNYEKKKYYLLKLYEATQQNNISSIYNLCEKELNKNDFLKYKPELLKKLKDIKPTKYLDICMEDNQKYKILKFLQSKKKSKYHFNTTIDSKHKYSRFLLDDYTNEVLKLYWKEVDFYTISGKHGNYSKAVEILVEIQNIMIKYNLKEEWNIKKNKYITENKSKRNLILLLKDNKLY